MKKTCEMCGEGVDDTLDEHDGDLCDSCAKSVENPPVGRSLVDMLKSPLGDEDDESEEGFSSGGTYVENPFWDETGRFPVDPEEHYGDAFKNSNVAKRVRWGEGASFDKFMDRILISEGHNRTISKEEQSDSPMRKRAARHQDRPLNKTRYGSK